MEPTNEQIKEFWKGYGFKVNTTVELGYTWDYPDSSNHLELPPIDLNNLFLYAVPRLKDGIDIAFSKFEDTGWFARLKNQVMTTEDEDPTLALFWALYKVMNER